MSPTTGSPKINLYNLGSLGVNRVLSPVHKTDGEYLLAQNAQSNKHNQGRDAIKKRWGMSIYNATAFGAGLIAIHNMPYGGFADPSTGSTSTSAFGDFGVVESRAYAGAPYISPWYFDGSTGAWAQTFDESLVYSLNPVGFSQQWIPNYLSSLPEDGSGSIYLLAYGLGSYAMGEIYKIDRSMVVTKVADPIGAPAPYNAEGAGLVTFTVSEVGQMPNLGGDPDFVIGNNVLNGSNGESYQHIWTYKISTNTYTWVGTPQRFTKNNTTSSAVYLDQPTYVAVVHNDKVIQNRRWFRSTTLVGGFSQIKQLLQSAPASTTGSWTDIKTADGLIQGDPAWVAADGNYAYTSMEMDNPTNTAFIYWNLRSSDGVTWTTMSALPTGSNPSSGMWHVAAVDRHRTVPAVFGYDNDSPFKSIHVTTDASDSWTTVSGSDISGSPVFFRAGDYFFLWNHDSPSVCLRAPADNLTNPVWTTQSLLAAALNEGFPTVQGIVRPTAPYTVY